MQLQRSFVLTLPVLFGLALPCRALVEPSEAADRPDQPLLFDAQDGRLDQLDLLEATLLANGIYDAGLQHEMRVALATYHGQLEAELAEVVEDEQRVRIVHEFMHTRILTGEYQADCTQFSRAIREGNFNCVSATVLFHLLCRPWRLDVQGVASPTHVFSRVRCEGGAVDVQTTCATWFRLSEAQRRQYNETHLPRSAEDGQLREIGELELLAKVYYNRGVRHLEARRYADAVEVFRLSLQLDPLDKSAQENLLASWNNWALVLCDAGEYAEAAKALAEGLAMNPQYPPLRANDLHIHQRWAQVLCEKQQYEQAAALLIAGRERQPSASLFREGPLAIYRMWAESLAERGDAQATLQVCTAAQTRFGDQVDASQWLATTSDHLRRTGRADIAARLLEAALSAQPESLDLLEARARLRGELSSAPRLTERDP